MNNELSESRQLSRPVNFERSQSIPSRQNRSTDRGNLFLTTPPTTTYCSTVSSTRVTVKWSNTINDDLRICIIKPSYKSAGAFAFDRCVLNYRYGFTAAPPPPPSLRGQMLLYGVVVSATMVEKRDKCVCGRVCGKWLPSKLKSKQSAVVNAVCGIHINT